MNLTDNQLTTAVFAIVIIVAGLVKLYQNYSYVFGSTDED